MTQLATTTGLIASRYRETLTLPPSPEQAKRTSTLDIPLRQAAHYLDDNSFTHPTPLPCSFWAVDPTCCDRAIYRLSFISGTFVYQKIRAAASNQDMHASVQTATRSVPPPYTALNYDDEKKGAKRSQRGSREQKRPGFRNLRSWLPACRRPAEMCLARKL